ncbi:hypothetical protein CA951_29125 [Rhodococcus sp. NCIMB 12038]|nr:hypothetical protein CA951_29125 [Rhodococcus sp. NCIMB 12038]
MQPTAFNKSGELALCARGGTGGTVAPTVVCVDHATAFHSELQQADERATATAVVTRLRLYLLEHHSSK